MKEKNFSSIFFSDYLIIDIFVSLIYDLVTNDFFDNIFESNDSNSFVICFSPSNFDFVSYQRKMIGSILKIIF